MEARTIVRADALFEAALGVGLLASALTGALGAADYPHPVGKTIVALVGAILLLAGGVLGRGAVSLPVLVAANVATAVAAVAWLTAASGFSAAGAGVLVGTAAVLVGLAVAEAATLRA